MNEKAEQLITDVGEKVLSYLEATEGFTVEQAPLLAQEIVRYGIWFNGIFTAFFLVVTPLLVWLSYRWGTSGGAWKDTGKWEKSEALCLMSGIPGVMGSIVIVMWILPNCMPDLLKAAIAPRLYIIEQIGSLM